MEKTIVMPSKEEMMTRLKLVHSEKHVVERLYPEFLNLAEAKATGSGVVLSLSLSIGDYCKGLGNASMVEDILFQYIPNWIIALIDDKEVLKEAQDFWNSALARAKKK